MLDKIKNKFKSNDSKVLLENFISLSALQVLGMCLPLINLPYIIRVIGFEKYGVIIFASSLITYFQALTDFSFKVNAVRDVAIFRDNINKLNIIYSKVVIVKSIFLIISIFILAIIVYLYPPFYSERIVYGLSAIMLIGYTIFPEWFFQGIEKMKYITYLNLGIKLFFTLSVFLVIKTESDYWKYPLLQSLGFLCAGVVGQLILKYKYKLKLVWLSKRIISNTISTNFPLFVNQFVPTLYNNSSVFLLGLMGTKYLVGVYQAIITVINLAITLIGIISRVFFPYLNRKKHNFPKYKKLMLSLVCVFIFAILVFNKLIFWYLNVDYEYSLILLLILSLGLLGYALSNIYGLNYFIIHRMDTLVMYNTLRASLIGFIIAFPLIYYYNILGAAITLSLSRWILGGGLWIKYIQHNGKN